MAERYPVHTHTRDVVRHALRFHTHDTFSHMYKIMYLNVFLCFDFCS